MQLAPLHKPRNLELDARVGQVVKVPARVLERERIRVDELLADEYVQLSGEVHERGSNPARAGRLGCGGSGGGGRWWWWW